MPRWRNRRTERKVKRERKPERDIKKDKSKE